MPNLSSLTTNFFATPNEGFTTTTSAPVDSSSATVVPFNSVSGLTNGSIFTGLIDPGNAKERAFTGVVDTGGSQITSVKFTTGTNATHTTGATIVDYVTGTHIGAMTKGIGISLDQDGTLKAGAVDVTGVLADSIVTKDKLSTAFELEHDSGWTLTNAGAAVPAPNTITNNGNRSYDMVFNSVDLTGYLSAGQRLRLTRTVSAPTQCADLESGSSQHFVVTNAVGLATGTTWTFKCKIKPESYTASTLIAIDDGTNLVELALNASGQIFVLGGTHATNDVVTSYQSVELGKWQDVTGSITIGTPTGEIRLNDTVIPSVVTASAATTMTISGDEEIYIGRLSSGGYFDGKICQVALFNSIVSDATLKTYSGQTMTGSETGCEGFWSLNNTLADLSANANTLTAGGGALATNVDSPFGNYLGGTLEYAIITKTAFSTNTTLTVQVPEGCAIPTSGGVSAVAYSTQASPYGFPAMNRFRVLAKYNARTQKASPVSTTVYNNGDQLNIPVGEWMAGYKVMLFGACTTSVTQSVYADLNPVTATHTTTSDFAASQYANASQELSAPSKIYEPLSVTAQANYYLNVKIITAGTTSTVGFLNDFASGLIYADLNM